MKVLLYGDWPLALTYLEPLAEYIKATEPDWVVQFAGDLGAHATPPIGVPDVVVTCDELSVAPDAPIKICIFHGMASKGQAFSTARRDAFVNRRQFYAVPSMFHVKLLLDLGVSEDRIFVSGLTKFDSLKRNVLYAPTHNPQLSAIPVIKDSIYQIDNVKVHLHMYTRTGDREHHKLFRSYYPVHEDRENIADLLGWADTIIGDMGSIVVEALALGKRAIQVVNPSYLDFYRAKGLPDQETHSLPEIQLPRDLGLRVYSADQLLSAVNFAPVGGASEKIVQKIKQYSTL
jgi:CDP-glycerol glycerophosphotransferase (TagB/SpsB family)